MLLITPLVVLASVSLDCSPNDQNDVPPIEHPILLSPSSEEEHAPTNVVLLLGGLLDRLELEEPTWRLRLSDPAGNDVVLTREGRRATPVEPLAPETWYTFVAEPTEAHGCAGCVTPWQSSFRTGSGPRTEPPVAGAFPRMDLGGSACSSATHLRFSLVPPEGTAIIDVAVSADQVDAELATQLLLGHAADGIETVDLAVPLARGDPAPDRRAWVAITFEDLAGHVSDAIVGRVPASETWDSYVGSCTQPERVEVASASAVPFDSDLLARFPFVPRPVEAVPLDGDDDAAISLEVREQDGATQRLHPARPLTPGVTYALRPLPCPGCACRGCGETASTTFTAADSDTTPPAPPRILDVWVDPYPPPQREGSCVHDRSAFVVHLEVPDDDDVVAYRGLLRRPATPSRVLALFADFDDDGDTRIVRLKTVAPTALAADGFELTLTALDAAGNEATTAISRPLDPAASCTATHPFSAARPWGALALLGLLGPLLRRRWR